jgi:hypothetical protein
VQGRTAHAACDLDILTYSIAADTWQAFQEQDRAMYLRDKVKE